MDKMSFILAVLLLAFAAGINGESTDDPPMGESPFDPQMPALTSAGVNIQPSFGQESQKSDSLIAGRLLSPAEGCGFTEMSDTEIVEQQRATQSKPGAWPWTALLGYRTIKDQNVSASFNCGGSLITSRHVLTAAHCLNMNLWFARLGEHDVTDDDGRHEDIAVFRWQQHPQYDTRLTVHDIGMIYFERDVQFSDRIRPICLPFFEPALTRNFDGFVPFVVGWGQQSSVLMQLRAFIIQNESCKEDYKRIKQYKADIQFSNSNLCARVNGGQGICNGDSGGPLIVPFKKDRKTFTLFQMGIISWGIPCDLEDIPAVYVNIHQYEDWIKYMIKKN